VSERTIECKEKYVITCLKSQIKNAALINWCIKIHYNKFQTIDDVIAVTKELRWLEYHELLELFFSFSNSWTNFMVP
jgi:hypothetical protein